MIPVELLLCVCSYLPLHNVIQLYRALRIYGQALKSFLNRSYSKVEIVEASLNRDQDVALLIKNRRINVDCVHFTLPLINKYIAYVDWRDLSGNPHLTHEIIQTHHEKWSWYAISRNPVVFNHPNPHILLDRYLERWDWDSLSRNKGLFQGLAPYFILDRYLERWNWSALSYHKGLIQHSECFSIIDRYRDRWDWSFLQRYLPLTLFTIKRYQDKWDWKCLIASGHLTTEVIDYCLEYHSVNWLNLAENDNVTLATKRKYMSYFEKAVQDFVTNEAPYLRFPEEKDFYSGNLGDYNYRCCSFIISIPLSVTLLDACVDLSWWFWLECSKNLSLTSDILERYACKWNYSTLHRNPVLGKLLNQHFLDHITTLQPESLFENTSCVWYSLGSCLTLDSALNYDIIDRYSDKWDWDNLSRNDQWVTPAFIDRYVDKITVGMIDNLALDLNFVVKFLLEGSGCHLMHEVVSDIGYSLSFRTDLTASFIAANPHIKWNWDLFIQYGNWTWIDILDYPQLPWSASILCRCTRKY